MFKSLFFFTVTIFVGCNLGNQQEKDSYSNSQIENNYPLALAIIDENKNPPNDFKIKYFKDILSSAIKYYPNESENNISDAIVSAYNTLFKNYYYEKSLLEFSVSLTAFYKELDESYRTKMTFTQTTAIFAKMISGQLQIRN